MAAMGELKGIHVPSPVHREFRSFVKYRKTLDRRINKAKNTIRVWFVNHGIEIAAGEKAWHTGREKINSFQKTITECGAEELWKGQLRECGASDRQAAPPKAPHAESFQCKKENPKSRQSPLVKHRDFIVGSDMREAAIDSTPAKMATTAAPHHRMVRWPYRSDAGVPTDSLAAANLIFVIPASFS